MVTRSVPIPLCSGWLISASLLLSSDLLVRVLWANPSLFLKLIAFCHSVEQTSSSLSYLSTWSHLKSPSDSHLHNHQSWKYLPSSWINFTLYFQMVSPYWTVHTCTLTLWLNSSLLAQFRTRVFLKLLYTASVTFILSMCYTPMRRISPKVVSTKRQLIIQKNRYVHRNALKLFGDNVTDFGFW